MPANVICMCVYIYIQRETERYSFIPILQAIFFWDLTISMPTLERNYVQLFVKRFGLLSFGPQLPITAQKLESSF